MKKTLLITFMALFATTLTATAKKVSDAPDPIALAQRANNYFMTKWSDPTEPTKAKKLRPSNLWTRAVYFEGLMALNDVAPEQRYMDYVDAWGKFHKWGPYSQKITTVDADHQCCAQTYIMRYQMVGGEEKISTMRQNFDNQIATGKNSHWTWIDAIQMAMPAYALMAKVTGDRKYLDYAMQSYTWSRDTCGGKLFNAEEGLWWRDANFVAPYEEPDGKNCYWSRGNGWVYAALCRTMTCMDKKDPYYERFQNDFILMSQALVKCQREDGFWNASLVSQDYAGKELTGTALFLYGMSWGVRNGVLSKKEYMPVIKKAWLALASCVHNDGFLGYVQGSGDRPASNQPVTYVKEPDFDDYGLGCFLLGATEYSKLSK